MKAGEILNRAAEIVGGARNTTHGAPERSFDRIAQLWGAYLQRPLTDREVCVMMALLKVARSETGDPREADHYIDGAGYLALAGEVVEAEAGRN